MGYWEIPCRLCGVVFNISRMRRMEEPAYEGWSNTGYSRSFVEHRDRGCKCTCDVGEQKEGDAHCVLAKRTDFSDSIRPEEENVFGLSGEEDLSETDDGSDFVPGDEEEEEEEEYERYEYETEDSDDNIMNDDDDDDDDDADEQENENENESGRNENNQNLALLRNLNSQILTDASQRFRELQEYGLIWKFDQTFNTEEAEMVYEHVAGPSCSYTKAYNGHKIMADEMRSCNVAQCLRRKHMEWRPTPDDQDFERETNFVLSGLTNYVRSTDNFGSLFRQVVCQEDLLADTEIWNDHQETMMPFHPTCFDIYMRLSRKKLNFVDLNGLMGFFYFQGHLSYPGNSNKGIYHHHHLHVRESFAGRWTHIPGYEYLAANPLFIPRLTPILRAAVETDEKFTARLGAFTIFENPLHQQLNNQHITGRDPFEVLPQELKIELISYLRSKDIASLRLASRVFRQLPIYIWRRLVLEEMPWLWEVWSDDPPYDWALVEHTELLKTHALWHAIDAVFQDYRCFVEEEMPEILSEWTDAWKEAVQQLYGSKLDLLANSRAAALKDIAHPLQKDRINWYRLYTEITRNWKDLKGLHNRARIWADIENIISEIQIYREEGKILE